jgi:hypothetical protein
MKNAQHLSCALSALVHYSLFITHFIIFIGAAGRLDGAPAGEPQTVAWAYERPGDDRGFGFTGGHNHVSWQNEGFRKIMLNAILWTAGARCRRTAWNQKAPD